MREFRILMPNGSGFNIDITKRADHTAVWSPNMATDNSTMKSTLYNSISNSSENNNIRFSLSDTAPADVDALMKENAEYKEAIEDLKAQFELTKGHKVFRKAVEKIAKGIIKKHKSSYEIDTLTDNMMKMFDYIGNAEQVAWDEVVKEGVGMARAVAYRK